MRLITGGTMRQWWPWLEEVNREVGPFGVALSGGVEQVRLRAPGLRETGNWLGITDCSNDVNATNRTVVFGEVANCVPALTPFVAKCYGTRLADVFFRMDSEETRTIPCSCLLYTSPSPRD